MSFNLDPLNGITPEIKAANIKDGHAGNTGYFKRGQKDSEEENQSVFKETSSENDTFTLKDAQEANYADPPFLLTFIEKIKNFFKKIFNL